MQKIYYAMFAATFILFLVGIGVLGKHLWPKSVTTVSKKETATQVINDPAKKSVSARLRLGVFPRRNIAKTLQAFRPLAKYLTEQLGTEVKLIVPSNFQNFWNEVKEKQYDIVHYNQYHYLLSRQYGYKVILANEELGRRIVTGSLVVNKKSEIKTLDDLKGRTILFGGGKKAMGSYIAPTAILKAHGLQAGQDYFVGFSKNPPAAIINVSKGMASAAGAGDMVINFDVLRNKIDTSKVKILARSDAFIHLPWAVSQALPANTKKNIQNLMISLGNTPKGQGILKQAKVTGFFQVEDKDFDKVREIVKFVLGEEL